MTAVKVNTITVNDGQDAHRLIDRIAARRREMTDVPGFLGVEVLAPTSQRLHDPGNYLLITRWATHGAYCAWLAHRDTSPATAQTPHLQAEVDLDEFDTIDLDRH